MDKCVERMIGSLKPNQIYFYPDRSVWWSWVAPSNSPVMIEKLGGSDSLNGFLAVYSFDPSEFWQDAIATIDLHWRGQYVTFNVQAGHGISDQARRTGNQ